MRIHSSSQEESVRTGEDAGDSQEELHTVRGPSGRGQETHATDQRQGQVSPFPSHTNTLVQVGYCKTGRPLHWYRVQ